MLFSLQRTKSQSAHVQNYLQEIVVMIRPVSRIGCLLVLLLAASFALAQTEFSADMVNTRKGEDSPGARIYFSKDKLRVEPAKKDAKGMGGVFLMNLATRTSTLIMDQRHMYMEMPADPANQRTVFDFFTTGDVESTCADWLKQEEGKGGTCHKIGNETVNGRNTVKFEGTNAKGEAGAFWIDPKLRFPVKWKGKDGEGELRNIQEGTQPANLFEIPAGYTKFDMGNMTKRPQ
jgi:hypothetical protein